MDNKFYVSLEAEELLIEKGYHIEMATPIYNGHGDVIGYCPADRPTKAEAMDWIESNTGFIISVDRRCDGFWYYVVFQGNDIYYDSDCFVDGSFLTRWEAEEAAIIKTLELL